MNSKKPTILDDSRGLPWLFVHIMKTAGTSFRNYLYDIESKDVYPSKEQLSTNPRKGWYLKADEFLNFLEQEETRGFHPHDYKFYFGHFPFALREKLNFNVRTAIVLREPVSRTLSMIKHRKRTNPEQFGKMTDIEMLEIEDFRERQITNYQTKVIGLTDGCYNVNARYASDDKTLERAILNLNKSEYIGLTENIKDSLALFHNVTKIQDSCKFPWLNQSDRQSSMSADFKAAVAPFIDYDKILYREATRLFYERLKQLKQSNESNGSGLV